MTAVEAAKVTIEKEPVFSETGSLLGYEDFQPGVLADLGFRTIADYPTFMAGDVAQASLDRFRARAASRGIMHAVRADFDLIQVNGYVFSSLRERPDGLPEDLVIARYDGPVELLLVQLKGPLTPQWHTGLAGVAEVISYYPENTFLVRAQTAARPLLEGLGGVQHVSLYQPAYKVRPYLLEHGEPMQVSIELDARQDVGAAVGFMESLLSDQLSVRGDSRFAHVHARVTPAQLRAVARRPEVLWVEPALRAELAGERDASIVSGQHDGLRPIRYSPDGYHSWLRSKGFCTPTEADPYPGCMVYWTKVGVVDSGLDRTRCLDYDEETGLWAEWYSGNRRHPDLNHASNLAMACPPPGEGIEGNDDCDDPVIRDTFFCSGSAKGNQCEYDGVYYFTDSVAYGIGHGTAVASLISGDPLSIVPGDLDPPEQDLAGYYRGTGIAPSAQLIVAKYTALAQGDPPSGGMTEEDYKDLLAHVEAQGARFATNSWNLYTDDHGGYGGQPGWEYTLFSKMADRLVRDADGTFDGSLSEMTLVFSAGNWDEQQHSESWVRSPGNAKNVITAGASRAWVELEMAAHDDCGTDTELIRDIPELSRRGFLHEHGAGGTVPRYKPDILAPGSVQIAAARSRHSVPPGTDYYRCFGATSAAAPQVAASAVLAEAWYYYRIDPSFASPAMVKAMLAAHADSMIGGTDHHPPSSTLPHSPSLAQGWGRLNLDPLLQQEVGVVALDQDHGSAGRRFTASGQFWTQRFFVDEPGEPIIVVMVYTDRYSEPGAASLTVNDLDLQLVKKGHPSGHTFWGNHFEPGSWYSVDTGGQILPVPPEDSHNTVEVIRVPPGVLADFNLRVKAKAVQLNAVPGLDNDGPNQDFALYVYNAIQ